MNVFVFHCLFGEATFFSGRRLFFFLVLSALVSFSAFPNVDSLHRSLQEATGAAERLFLLNELAWHHLQRNPDSAEFYAQEALGLARLVHDDSAASLSLNVLGNHLRLTGDAAGARVYLEEALQLRRSMGDSSLIGFSLNNLGSLARSEGHYSEALQYYLEASSYLRNTQHASDLAKSWYSIGIIHQQLGAGQPALIAFERALEIHSSIGDPEGWASTLLAIGGFYQSIQQFDRSIESYRTARLLYSNADNRLGVAQVENNTGNSLFLQGDLDSALVCYRNALEGFRTLGFDSEVARCLNNLGLVYSEKEEHKKALKIQQESLALWEEQSKNQGYAEGLLNMALIYRSLDEKNDSIQWYLHQALILADERRFRVLQQRVLRELGQWWSARGDVQKALTYLTVYADLSDSLELNYQQAVNLQFQLDEEKRQRMEQQVLSERLKLENEQQSIILLTGGIIFLLLLFASIAVIIILRQRKQRVELERDKRAQELASVRTTLEKIESERVRIARELHDELGLLLSHVAVAFRQVDRQLDEQYDKLKMENRQARQLALGKLDEAIRVVRRVAYTLDTGGLLRKFGLVPAVKELVKSIEQASDIVFEFNQTGFDERLAVDMEEALFRIIQELLNNVLKHSQATEVSVQLNRMDGLFNLMVEDNGLGFDPNELDLSTSMGIRNIEARLEPFSGTLELDSRKGRGTIVNIHLEVGAGNSPEHQPTKTDKPT